MRMTPEQLASIATAIAQGGVPAPDSTAVHITRQVFYHKQAYAQAGQTSLKFFNVAKAFDTTNFPQPSSLPSTKAFVLERIAVELRAGDPVLDAADLSPPTDVDKVINAIETGYLNFEINGRKILDEVRGLWQFPTGGGVVVNPSIAATGAAAPYTNGVPHSSNGFWLGIGKPVIKPNEAFEIEVKWPSAVALTTAGEIAVHLDGWLVQPSGV